jgi:hypothetical protein
MLEGEQAVRESLGQRSQAEAELVETVGVETQAQLTQEWTVVAAAVAVAVVPVEMVLVAEADLELSLFDTQLQWQDYRR